MLVFLLGSGVVLFFFASSVDLLLAFCGVSAFFVVFVVTGSILTVVLEALAGVEEVADDDVVVDVALADVLADVEVEEAVVVVVESTLAAAFSPLQSKAI